MPVTLNFNAYKQTHTVCQPCPPIYTWSMGYHTQGLADKHLDQYIPIGSLAVWECVSVTVASQAVSILNKSSLKKNFLLIEFHIHFVLLNLLVCRSSVESWWKYLTGIQISRAVLRGFLIRFQYIICYIVIEGMWEAKGKREFSRSQGSGQQWELGATWLCSPPWASRLIGVSGPKRITR